MSLTPSIIESVPAQTVLVAHAAFPKGNLYLSMRDELGTLFEDQDFIELFSRLGYPAVTPWRLALITTSAVSGEPVRPPDSRSGSFAGVRRGPLRRSRYRGLEKTHLQEVATATAINIVRAVNFLNQEIPAKTRVSRFARLAN